MGVFELNFIFFTGHLAAVYISKVSILTQDLTDKQLINLHKKTRW